MGPWEKDLLGWISEVVFVGPGLDLSYTLGPVQASGKILRIPLEPDVPNAEYYLVEYRTKEGFDADLPSSGVLIYHIDPKIGGNRPCDTCPQLYRVGLVEADGNASLRRTFLQGGNRGEPGDAWGFVGPGFLTNNSTPSSHLNSGDPSAVTIYSIAIEDGVASLNLSSRVIPTPSLLQGFLRSTSLPLTEEEEGYLDSKGNGNGQFDVGDLRTYLRR
jgi:immune inhibitor A